MNEPPPSGCSRPGQNQPSAWKSVAAPSAIAALIGSPVLVARGAIVQATSPGTSCSRRISALPSKPPAPSSTPRAAPISTGPSGDIAATPTTRPVSSVTRPVTGRLVRISPPSRTKIAVSRAISDCPPLRVLRPPSPARSRSTGGRTSSATSGGRSPRLTLVGWIDRPKGTRPGAS